MLTQDAINRMLKVFKPLTKLEVKNSSLQNLGNTSVIWNDPSGGSIKTQPFTVVSQPGDITWFHLNNNVIDATSAEVYNDKITQPPTNLTYYRYYMDLATTPFENDKIGTKVVQGFDVQGKKYPFVVFRTGISLERMDKVGLNSGNLPGGDLDDDDITNSSNLNRLESFLYAGSVDPDAVIVNATFIGGSERWLLVPRVYVYTIDASKANLQYILSNYTVNNLNITEETLLRIPNGITETLVKGSR